MQQSKLHCAPLHTSLFGATAMLHYAVAAIVAHLLNRVTDEEEFSPQRLENDSNLLKPYQTLVGTTLQQQQQ